MGINRLIILSLFIAGVACSRNNVQISGSVEGGAGTSLTLERLDVNRTSTVDSVVVKKEGSFTFRVKLEEPELFLLRNEQGDLLNLLLFPGDRVSIHTRYDVFGKDYRVDGSPESEKIRLLVNHLAGSRAVLDSLESAAESITDQGDPRMKIIRTAYAQAILKQKRFTIRYLVENMNSLSSVYALYQKYESDFPILGEESDLQYFKSVADSLEKIYPNSSLIRSLTADIEAKENRYNEQQKLNTLLSMADESNSILDLSIPDRNGNRVTLSSLKGNVVLVVFWSSGNKASINTLLQLQKIYERYHPKGFEIYAVSLDNDKINWMKAIDFNEFNWINVSELSYPGSNADRLFNVSELPTSFLINKEGEIMVRNLYGRTLETWLDNLL